MRTSESSPASAVTRPDKEHVAGGWLDAWHVNPSLNKDYDVIDGLRGMAILMVVTSHIVYAGFSAGATEQLMAAIFGTGAWGVTLFFALSGFLISYPFWKRKIRASKQAVPAGYAGRRFWKIYPPLALSIVVLAPYYYYFMHDRRCFLDALLWLSGWPLLHSVSDRCNTVMWSLIVEVHFYVLLPLLFLCMKRISVKRALWIMFSTLLVVPTAFRWWNLSHGVYFHLHPDVQVHFPTFLDSFAFGVLLAGLENLRLIRKSWVWLGDIGFVLLGVSSVIIAWYTLHPVVHPEIQREIHTWAVKLAAGLMICYIADAKHFTARWLAAPWLRWCGLISYEWYLFHQPIVIWMRGPFGPSGGSLVKFGIMAASSFLVTAVIAALVYRFFSLPILKFGRKRNAASA